jgi:hypothetical protein
MSSNRRTQHSNNQWHIGLHKVISYLIALTGPICDKPCINRYLLGGSLIGVRLFSDSNEFTTFFGEIVVFFQLYQALSDNSAFIILLQRIPRGFIIHLTSFHSLESGM